MKLHILFPFQDGPTGGGNQFLAGLRRECQRLGAWAADPAQADAILFNSHHDAEAVIAARSSFPQTIFLHRVDGIMRRYSGGASTRDRRARLLNRLAADGTLYQSHWSLAEHRRHGIAPGQHHRVIPNAADPAIFQPRPFRDPGTERRRALIATSWSANPQKGFDVLAELDRTLDFQRYEMTFVGNAPLVFANIRHIPPCPSAELAGHLAAADLFLAPSTMEVCSNALLEAMTVGLPVVARRDGGHPELVGGGGLLFEKAQEVTALIDRVFDDYAAFASKVNPPRLEAVGRAYLDFAQALIAERDAGRLKPRRPGWFALFGGRPFWGR